VSNELPGEWGELLGPKGIHSYRHIAARVGISAGTAHRLVTGGATSADTVKQVADALFDGDRDLVWRLRGSRRRDHGDWTLPAEASLLTPAQREAVRAVVVAMVPAEHEESDGDVEATPTKDAGGPGDELGKRRGKLGQPAKVGVPKKRAAHKTTRKDPNK
jgi:hypothetical protein